MPCAQRARPAIGKGPRIRRVLQDGEDRGDGGAFPDDLPEAIAAREAQALALNTSSTLLADRRCKNVSKTKARRDWTSRLGSLCTRPCASRSKPVGQRQGQVAPGRLVEEPGGHAGADGMQLPFRQVPFNPRRSRPLAVAGSYRPSTSAIKQPL